MDEGRALVVSALGRYAGGGWLDPGAVAELLACYGIPLITWRLAATRGGRRRGGGPARRGGAEGVRTRVDPQDRGGAVALGVEGPASVEAAAGDMAARLESARLRPDRFLVQPMASCGVEMIVGVVQDPLFGQIVACGAGGTAVELLKDVRVGLAPLTESTAAGMVHGLATFPLLQGYRGSPPADLGALQDLLLRVGALAEELPEVVEVDLNPVLAEPDGACTLDDRVRVEAYDPYRRGVRDPGPVGGETAKGRRSRPRRSVRPWWRPRGRRTLVRWNEVDESAGCGQPWPPRPRGLAQRRNEAS